MGLRLSTLLYKFTAFSNTSLSQAKEVDELSDTSLSQVKEVLLNVEKSRKTNNKSNFLALISDSGLFGMLTI